MATAHSSHAHSSLERASQIALVLAHHELWSLVEILDLGRFVPFHLRRSPPPQGGNPELHTPPEHLCAALEELGPTFMKLGQMLSTRDDLLPPAYQRELATLQDAAPTIPFETVRETIAAELGQPLEHAFATFESMPLAAASIGQAHLATLQDGTAVVVKVRRPGAVEQVDEDLKLLHSLATVASHHSELAKQYDVVGLVQEFDQSLRAELDYLREGHNAERFARNFAGEKMVQIPRVFWETTTSRVLTQERIHGIKVTDLAALQAAGIDRTALSKRGAQIFLKMVFEDGFFHADLHPGNLFIEEGGHIGLIDFGMVGSVDKQTREELGLLLSGVTSQNTDRLVDALLELGATQQPVDRAALCRDLEHVLSQFVDQPLSALPLGPLLTEMFSIVRRHHLVLPSRLTMLLKTTITTEGMAVQLDPSFNLVEALTPYVKRLMLQENSPVAWASRFGKAVPDLLWLATELPLLVRQLVGDLDRGSLKIAVQPTGLDSTFNRAERIANRIVLGSIVAAFIIALAVLLSVAHPGGSPVWSGALTIGFVVAAVLGLYLVWSIFRSGRH
ncbi:MAG: AarF/ABC1/UbiB kinase family protein [Chloroflexi bacterium]|nr:MAG: AarF/ABC1/UbiB kinase family protein [Chloroflexota bacterium]